MDLLGQIPEIGQKMADGRLLFQGLHGSSVSDKVLLKIKNTMSDRHSVENCFHSFYKSSGATGARAMGIVD